MTFSNIQYVHYAFMAALNFILDIYIYMYIYNTHIYKDTYIIYIYTHYIYVIYMYIIYVYIYEIKIKEAMNLKGSKTRPLLEALQGGVKGMKTKIRHA